MPKYECARVKLEHFPFEISNSTNQPTSHLLTLLYDCTLLVLHTGFPTQLSVRRFL
jgi:hypothetical protein